MLSNLKKKLTLGRDRHSDLCPRCRKIDFATLINGVRGPLSWETSGHDIGTLAQLGERAPRCVFCSFVHARAVAKGRAELDAAKMCFVKSWPVSFINWRDDSLKKPKARSPNDLLVGVTDDTTRLWGEHVTYLATLRVERREQSDRLPAPVEEFGRARMLHDDHVDINLCKAWIDLCKTRHKGTACATAAKQWPQHLYVVDVKQRCVVSAKQGCEYVALSYVWGTATSLKLSSLDDCDLFCPGAIDQHWQTIAPTVRDAIDATGQLGFDYLWMDALCIPQDNRNVKQTLMAQMNFVYANAALTIVAAAGVDANHGLTGLSSRSGGTNQTKLSFDGLNFVTTLHGGDDRLEKQRTTTWGTRAWTYEEQVFSRRQLIFTDSQVGWRCCCAMWREEMVLESFDDKVDSFSGPSLLAEPLFNPDSLQEDLDVKQIVKHYNEAVGQYRRRELTFPYDALNAFKGIGESFASIVDWRFFWGLPEVAFTPSLAWVFEGSVRNDAVADWRLIKKGMSKDRHHIRLPSWSWAGWQRPRDNTKSSSFGSGVVPPFGEITWYRVGENDSLLKVKEDVTFGMAKGNTTFWPADAQPAQTHWIGSPQTIQAAETVDDDDFVDLGLLKAWTRTCRLKLRYHAEPVDATQRNSHLTLLQQNNAIIDAKPAQQQGQGHFDISVQDAACLFAQQQVIEVTAVALGRNWSFDTVALLTEVREQVCHRVGLIMIPEVIWMTLDSRWELVTLG
ncbi:hypothetical protein FH972_025203 [Carpinus fangiana]|uniref:Heterokaryon incompatibility domain-containing protein n=1 Tax=Carpinus fangiana TaxID=176857 RepID=A0A5N6L0K3_9ROSI|nr:hypothetical protein FH972_025203 [Carpinus fangiana]